MLPTAARRSRRVGLLALAVLGLAATPAQAAPPQTTVTGGPQAPITHPNNFAQPYTLSADKAGVTFTCDIDGVNQACGPYLSLPTTLADGVHTVTVTASDVDGPDPTPETRTVTVAIPPETLEAGRQWAGNGSFAQFTFYSNDTDVARFECSVDGAAWSTCSSPLTVTNLAPGLHSMAARAVDVKGNTDASPATWQFVTQAPYVPPVQPQQGPYPYPYPQPPQGFVPGQTPVPTRVPLPIKGRPGRPGRPAPTSSVLQLLSGPAIGPNGIEARVSSRAAGTLRMIVAPKDAPQTVIASTEAQLPGAPVPTGRRGGGGAAPTTGLKAAFTPEGKALLARTGRLPVVVTLVFTVAGQSTPVTETTALTLLKQPVFARSGSGVKRPGGWGVERIRGSRGGDVLGGQSGNDRLFGLAGNDRLTGGTGNDTLQGGAGNDSMDGNDGDDRVFGGPGDDLIVEERFGDDYLNGGPGNDWIVGGRGIDRIDGGPGDDVIYGSSAPDTVNCGAGDDVVFINLQSERSKLTGCEEVHEEGDIVSVQCGQDGSDAPETLLGTDGDDTCRAGGGADDVEGAGGHDQLYGGDGPDRMFGRFGKDKMFGEGGDDEMEGGRDADLLDGGAGDDQLNGGYGNDVVRGGAGNDKIIARSGGRDRIDCGPGRDTAIGDRNDTFKNCESIKRG